MTLMLQCIPANSALIVGLHCAHKHSSLYVVGPTPVHHSLRTGLYLGSGVVFHCKQQMQSKTQNITTVLLISDHDITITHVMETPGVNLGLSLLPMALDSSTGVHCDASLWETPFYPGKRVAWCVAQGQVRSGCHKAPTTHPRAVLIF